MRVFLLFAAVFLAVTSLRAEEGAREPKPRMKGVELYSWPDEVTKTWHFALLNGSNRQKTFAEIAAPERAVADVALLKVQLARLAVGEQIVWAAVDRKHPLLPPQDVIDDIARTAAALQLRFRVPLP